MLVFSKLTSVRSTHIVLLMIFANRAAGVESWAGKLEEEARVFATSTDRAHKELLFVGTRTVTTSLNTLVAENWVSKLDLNGGLVWSQTYPFGPHLRFAEICHGTCGGVYLSGSSSGAARFDENGEQTHLFTGLIMRLDHAPDVDWARLFEIEGGDRVTFTSIAPTGDGGVAALADEPHQAFIVRLDDQGNLKWQKSITELPALEGNGEIVEVSDGGLIAILDFFGTDEIGVIKLNDRGDPVWLRKISSVSTLQAAHADAAKGLILLVLRSGAGSTLLRIDTDGNIAASKKLETASGVGDLAPTSDGGWLVGATSFVAESRGIVAKLDASFVPQWGTRLARQPEHVAEVQTCEQCRPNYVIVAFDSEVLDDVFVDREMILVLNEFGETADEACELAERADVSLSDVVMTSSEFTASLETPKVGMHSDLDAERRNVSVGLTYACREPDRRPCFDELPPELPPCVGIPWVPPVGRRGTEQRAGLEAPSDPATCHDDPKCPQCVRSLAAGGKYLANPVWRANLFSQVQRLESRSLGRWTPKDMDALVGALERAKAGRYFTDDIRKNLVAQAQKVRGAIERGRIDRGHFKGLDIVPCLVFALSQIDLDLGMPASGAPTKQADGLLNFGNIAWVQCAPDQEPAWKDAAFEIRAGVGPLRHHKPGWPAMAFQWKTAKTEPADHPATVSIYYGGMRFSGAPNQLRLLQRTDAGYRDITRSVNTQREQITGSASGPGVLVVVESVEQDGGSPRLGPSSRVSQEVRHPVSTAP